MHIIVHFSTLSFANVYNSNLICKQDKLNQNLIKIL